MPDALTGADGEPGLASAFAVSVRFGSRTVLQRIDLAVGPGEIVTLVGPNGAGKTTLVRLILGLLQPTEGRIWRRPGLRIGYLPQRIALDPVLPLTVRRLMTLTRRLSRLEIGRALGETGVGHLARASVHDLSGGELQRVLLARALALDPDLLVLDEPVQGVDFAGEADLYRLIAEIRRRRGCGVLMVSHDLHVVMAATDRVICLNHHVCCAGTPETVGRHPEYARLFGPRAAQAFGVYTHHHDHEHGLHGEVFATAAVADASDPAADPLEARR
jgi:zinc transport system ATP-binding protein